MPLVILFLFIFTSPLSAAEWIRLRSENFELLTSADQAQGQQLLQQFEQVANFFQELNQTPSTSSIPLRIVAFSNEQEFAPFRAHQGASAFFDTAPDADYIVLSGTSKSLYSTALHEYVHLLIRRSHKVLPLWLEEGFADLFSTLKAVGNRTQIGGIPPGRNPDLLRQEMLSLRVLISADRNSPLYTENNRIGMFYNESWALTHMLRLSDTFRNGFESFFNLMLSGHSTEDALQGAYGRSLSQVELDLHTYLVKGRLRLVLVPIKLKKATALPTKMDDVDYTVRLTLANLTRRTDPALAMRQLEQLSKENPSRPEPIASLGYLNAVTDPKKAMDAMSQAIEMGYRNPRLFKDFAALQLASGNLAKYVTAARRQLELEPDDVEQRQRIAAVLFQMTDYAQALVELQKVKSPPPELAARQYLGIAYCAIQLNDWPLAKKALEDLRQVSRSAEENAAVNKIAQAIEIGSR